MSDQKDHEQPEVNEADTQSESVESAEVEPSVEAEQISTEEQIESLEQALGEAKEAVLRAQADAINSQRRAEKEIEKARKFALEGFSREVLVVADNLERALSVVNPEDESAKPIVEGIELTLKSFSDVLTKFNVEALDPHGEPFDPQMHQAMSMVPNPEVEPNTVIAVMQKGYTLNGRLIRPAMVMVSKAD